MAETNEVLKQHTALLNVLETLKPIDVKLSLDKIEKALNISVKKEIAVK